MTKVSPDHIVNLWCGRCGGEIYPGQRYYLLRQNLFCPDCLPAVAAELLLPFSKVLGEEVSCP